MLRVFEDWSLTFAVGTFCPSATSKGSCAVLPVAERDGAGSFHRIIES